MKRLLLLVGCIAGGLAAPALGQTLQVEEAQGDLLDRQPRILLLLSDNLPAALEPQALDPSRYEVTAASPAAAGDVVPAVETQRIPVSSVTFGPNHSVLVLQLTGFTYGEGEVRVPEMTAGGATLQAATLKWSISQPYKTRPELAHHQSLRLHGRTAVVDFSFDYAGFVWKTQGNPYRIAASLEGSLPIGTPRDVEEAPGAQTDASKKVADFLKLSLLRTAYHGRGVLQSVGLVARSTAQYKGAEAVGTYQVARLFADNRFFTAAEVETGYREGDAEWLSLTQPAPDRGNLVARAGSVVEWGPRLGPINRDLGNGLRFFVRGRGWADWADDETGKGKVRLRGFFDAELFYNVSGDFRVFLRFENGYLPPDLSERHKQAFAGVGTAF